MFSNHIRIKSHAIDRLLAFIRASGKNNAFTIIFAIKNSASSTNKKEIKKKKIEDVRPTITRICFIQFVL